MAEIVLTPEQRAVVEDRGGALLVSAAAGSGKTRVLVDRVLRRVMDPAEQRNVDEFLMITFTQAAASELRGKLIAELSARLAQDPENRHLQRQMSRVYLAQISTVHSFCGALLRDYAHVLELPADFRVIDEQEAAELRQRVMDGLLESAYAKAGTDAQLQAALDMLGAGRDDRALPGLIEKVYFSLQCYPDPAGTLAHWRETLDVSGCTDAGETVWGAYLLGEFRRAMESCTDLLDRLCTAARDSGAVDAYLPTLCENRELLRAMAAVDSWEAAHGQSPDFGRLGRVTKCPDPELQERIKAGRRQVTEEVRRRLQPFSLSSREALADLQESARALLGLLDLAETFSGQYAREKKRRHLLDYNDLEHFALRLLTTRGGRPSITAREVSQRFAEIMVDEYQDTNQVQDAIFQALSREGRNRFMVGDVKQSIYRFRLADPTIFLEKYRSFRDHRAAEEGEPRKILLSDNFRSHREILAAANDVFRLTMTPRVGGLHYGDAEALRAKREMPDLGSPAVELHCIDMRPIVMEPPVERQEVEAEFVARRIAQMLEEGTPVPEGDGLRPVRPEDIVILMRSLSGRAQVYLDALRRHGIAAVCGSDDLFAAEEVLFTVALLQVIDNPYQDIPLLTVLFSPVCGFRADELARLRAANRNAKLYTILTGSARGAAFCEQLECLRDLAQAAPLRTLLDELDERLLVRTIYGAMPGGRQRLRNLDALWALADGYSREERHGLPGFLRYLEGLREKGVPSDDGSGAGAVRLMTVHRSKGLEFPVVFLADLCKGFNHADARAVVLIDPVLGIGSTVYDTVRRAAYPTIARTAIADRTDRESCSEEMRVLYVAMTRAQYRLVMTCCSRRLLSRLTAIARDLTIPSSDFLLEQADSLADWILTAAMARTEAGALFAAAGKPDCSQVREFPWDIRLWNGADFLPQSQSVAAVQSAPEEALLQPCFGRPYAHQAATVTPTKLTATQLKGRNLDEEAAEQAPQAPALHFPKPRFTEGLRPLTPAERGTAIHLAMQFLNYDACRNRRGIQKELRRLGEQRFLSEQQLAAVDAEKLWRFFSSPLGQQVLQAPQVVREFKFSVLEDAAILDPALQGEKILLQGVTDCCLLEPEGLTILDFKSDRIAPGKEMESAAYYKGQLDAYSRALSRIFAMPARARVLYFFATDTAVWL